MSDNAATDTSLTRQATKTLIVASSTAIVPTPPKGISTGELEKISTAARSLVLQFTNDPHNRRLSNQISMLGTTTQMGANKLLKGKVKTLLMPSNEGEDTISNGLVKLRKEADALNPELFRQPKGWIAKLLRWVPGMGDVLANIALSYDSAQATIDAIIAGLEASATERQTDNVELSTLAEQIREFLIQIRKDAYQSELMFTVMQKTLASLDLEAEDRQRIGAEEQRLLMRIQDLRSMEAALLLGTTEVNSSIDTNNELCDTINRLSNSTQFMLMIALTTQFAIARAKKSRDLVVDTKEFTNDLIESTASAAGVAAVDSAKLMSDPVIAFNSLKQGAQALFAGLDEADRIKNARIEQAQKALPQLQEITDALEKRLAIMNVGSGNSASPEAFQLTI